MIQIRKNVFETNSSSTHSITLVKKEEYDKWVKGEYYIWVDSWEFISKEEALTIREDLFKQGEDINMWDFPLSFEEFNDYDIVEYDHILKDFNIDNIDIVAIGYHGYD